MMLTSSLRQKWVGHRGGKCPSHEACTLIKRLFCVNGQKFLTLGAFRQKVEEYLDNSETNAIFKADLQTMLLIIETEEDLQTLRKMIIRQVIFFPSPLCIAQFSLDFLTQFLFTHLFCF